MTLLNPDIITMTPFATGPIVAGIVSIGVGFFVLSREQGSRLGQRYFFLAAALATYAVGAGISFGVESAEHALFFERVAHVGVVWIPATLLAVVTSIVGRIREFGRAVTALRIYGVIATIVLWATPWHIAGATRHVWGWYPAYGWWGVVFVFFFTLVVVTSLHLMNLDRRSADDAVVRRRLTFIIAAVIVGAVGGVDFLPVFGIEIYPFGFAPITLFGLGIGAILLTDRLVDITPARASGAIISTMNAAVVVVDRADIIRVANSRAQEWLGFRERDMIDASWHTVRSERVRPYAQQTIDGSDSVEIWYDGEGTERIVTLLSSGLDNRRHRERGRVFIAHDISQRARAERELERIALTDALTGLANRASLFKRLPQLVALAGRSEQGLALLFIDLDGFKQINDTWGHEAGDAALVEASRRIIGSLRESDFVARVGGDEFVAVLHGVEHDGAACTVADKIAEAVGRPYRIGEVEARLSASVGVATFPWDAADADTLVSTADRAMYVAKRRGGNAAQLFSEIAAGPDSDDAVDRGDGDS